MPTHPLWSWLRTRETNSLSLPQKERDNLSQAVNERTDPQGRPRKLLAMAPYSDSPLTHARNDPTDPSSAA
jgi:hypothetical protein